MGFKNLDLFANGVIPGFQEFANPLSSDAFQEHPDRAHQMLLHFARSASMVYQTAVQ
jgi:hypothetical protein